MSSSRSVAAARARRAGDSNKPTSSQIAKGQYPPQYQNSQVKPKSNYSQQSQQSQPSQPSQPKLSISDAFALTTLRLGRVETLLQKWENADVPMTTGGVGKEDVNNNVVRALVNRIEDLEKSTKNSVSSTLVDESITDLTCRIDQLTNDLRDAKDTIYKLQSMTLDTSQKIMTMMITKPLENTTSNVNEIASASVLEDVEKNDNTSDVDESSDKNENLQLLNNDVIDENVIIENGESTDNVESTGNVNSNTNEIEA